MQKISYRFIPKRYPLSCLILRSKRPYGYFNWDIQKRWSSSTGVLPTNRPSLHIPLHQQLKQSFQTKSSVSTETKEKVIILGSGWAGFKLMRDLDKEKYDVSVVSPRNYFVFTPLLASTSVGTLEFRCITEPVRSYSKNIKYHQAYCDEIDLDSRVAHCTYNVDDIQQKRFTLDYDKLIIAVGSYSNTFGIPGVKDHAFFLKDVNDARKIRKRLIECFENASQPGVSDKDKADLLHFVVVGGGPTGIEFSGELYDFIANDLSRLYPTLMPFIRMTLYDVAPNILGSFDSRLADYCHKKFDRKGIKIKTQRYVEEVTKNHVIIKEEGKVPYGLLVWSTGLMQNPLVKSLSSLAKDASKQRILTNGKLQVVDRESGLAYSNVYAIGDCATIKNNDLPATAQVATQKAGYLSKALNSVNSPISDFKFRNKGMMAYIGTSEALLDMSSVHRSAKKSGRLAWLLWRSAYFSMSMNTRNKMLIAYHWFLTWSFGRDISRF
ncbi:hypothetical protein RMATCC62417_02009 [Rhizopus microsporus]|nr:hypothetical protein RMATCC62417_02009 [Rhizopus microsporus]